MAKVNLPQSLSNIVEGNSIVEIDSETVEELFSKLINKYPKLTGRILKENGEFNLFVNIYVNEEDIRFLEGKRTPLKNTDEVTVVPASSGG